MEDSDLRDLKETVDRIDRRTRSIVAGAYAVIGAIAISSIVACTLLWGPGFAVLVGAVLLVGVCAGRIARTLARKQLDEIAGPQPTDGSGAAGDSEGREE
ncbi:MAG: hypothetical protein ACYS9X_20560 [Planctomycetota bacterium]|jgi:hypothetical protein